MNDKQERLLQDLIRDQGYLAFRDELWHATIAEAQRRRWLRTRNRYLAVAACLVLGGLVFAWREWQPQGGAVRSSPIASVRSGPLRNMPIVRTRPGGIAVIATGPWSDSLSPESPSLPVIVRTELEPGAVPQLSDQDLQDLFRGHPTALVSLSSGRAQFIFLDPSDEARFVAEPFTH